MRTPKNFTRKKLSLLKDDTLVMNEFEARLNIVYHWLAEISIGAHYVANSSLDMNWIMHLPWHMWCTQMGLLNVVMRNDERFMFQLEHKVRTKE